jgi:hypothetical protein
MNGSSVLLGRELTNLTKINVKVLEILLSVYNNNNTSYQFFKNIKKYLMNVLEQRNKEDLIELITKANLNFIPNYPSIINIFMEKNNINNYYQEFYQIFTNLSNNLSLIHSYINNQHQQQPEVPYMNQQEDEYIELIQYLY